MFNKLRAKIANKNKRDQDTTDFIRSKEITAAHKQGLSDIAIACTQEQGDQAYHEITTAGTLNGQKIPKLMGKWGMTSEHEKAERLVDVYRKSPDVANFLVSEQIAGFHGTNSSTLLGVLQSGLMTSKELRNRNEMITAGEHYFTSGQQNFVSFVDWREPDVIANYSGINGNGYEKLSVDRINHDIAVYTRRAAEYRRDGFESQADSFGLMADDLQSKLEFLGSNPDPEQTQLIWENFPVAYGISISDYQFDADHLESNGKGSTLIPTVQSDVSGEFGIRGGVLPEDIKAVAVPADQMDYVKELAARFGRDGISVIPIETIAGLDNKTFAVANG